MRNEKTILSESEDLELFTYASNDTFTRIALSAEQVYYKKNACYITHRYHLTKPRVEFICCDVDLSNSYHALNAVFAVVMAYEKRQFSVGTSSLSVKIGTNNAQRTIYAFSQLATTSQGRTVMNFGISEKAAKSTYNYTQSMHIGYVYAFHNALQKAMNWLNPVPRVGYDGNL